MRARLNAWMPQGSFLRNVSILTGGTIFAQGLMVLALPVLTRLYTPDDFNLLAVYVSTLGMVTTVSCLRYNIAIPLPEDDADGMALLALSIIAALGISFLCALPVLLVPEASAVVLGQPGLAPYLWMIPIGILIASLYNALQYWASRKKRFGLVTKTRITRAVGGVGTQLGIGVYSGSSFGLIFGQMLAEGLGIAGILRDLFRNDRKFFNELTLVRIRNLAIEYIKFPFISSPEALFNSASTHLPIILIASSVGGSEGAFLFLTMRVMGIPMRLIGTSVSQVFFVEAPTNFRAGTLAEFTDRTTRTLFKVGAPPLLLIGLVSPFAFSFVFGEEWSRAGTLVAWLTPWFLLQFITSPVSVVLQVTKHLNVALWLQVFGMGTRVGLVWFGLAYLPDFVSEIFAISGVLYYFVFFLIVKQVVANASEAKER